MRIAKAPPELRTGALVYPYTEAKEQPSGSVTLIDALVVARRAGQLVNRLIDL
jgi:hypothetical protein